MGFFDDEAGGAEFIKFDARTGEYKARGRDASFTDQEFIVDLNAATGGYLRFNAGRPERHTGRIFPKDEAPRRNTLPDNDPAKWSPGKFSGGKPEDHYRPIVELPLRHRETGETFVLTLQNKNAMAAARDFLNTCRKLPDDAQLIVRLGASNVQTQFGTFKKPNFSVTATTGAAEFDDPVDF